MNYNSANLWAVTMLVAGALGGYILLSKDNGNMAANEPRMEDLAVSETMEFVSVLDKIPEDKIVVVSSEEVEWPDGCLGLPQADEMCTEALVPGFLIVLNADGRRMVFRTDKTGSSIRRDMSAEKAPQ